MKFRTEIVIPPCEFNISHQDKIMMVGSCFVENISAKLFASGFHVNVNPSGIVYNPISVKMVLEDILQKKEYTREDLFFHEGIYHSFSHHSRFSGFDPERVVKTINEQIKSSFTFLLKARSLFITFGTANVYFLSDSKKPVANCHKLPSHTFYNRRLSTAEIIESWNRLIERLKDVNPEIEIVFTISPIRHWKDGAHENQVSKSTLFLAVEQLLQDNPNTHYFPSYELLMDDLRDYRFYAEDMLHPSMQAIEYIWNKFSETYFSADTQKLIKEWSGICQAFNHRPFNPELEEYKIFLKKVKKRKADFLHRHPEFKDCE
ncbi:MAG: GSCFA domain-containing protein [Bacteroidales bacterium]|nr:GSCFA domain-containing protein [Bacteroidales bacterium]